MKEEINDFMKGVYKDIGPSDLVQDVGGWIDTGLLPLNDLLSGSLHNGIPMGRVTEIAGGESSGKTALAVQIAIATQKKDGLAIFLDFEHALSIMRAQESGLSTSPNQWIYKQPETAEDGFVFIEKIGNRIIESGSKKPVVVIVDSVACMPTLEEMKAGYKDLNMKTNLSLAMCLTRCLRKIVPLVNKSNIALIFINQLRETFGEYAVDHTPGGTALKFQASVRNGLSKAKKDRIMSDNGKDVTGEVIKVTNIKNKVAIGYKTCEYVSTLEDGIDFVATHIRFANKLKLLGTSKGWVEWNGEKMRQKELTDKLADDPKAYLDFLKIFDEDHVVNQEEVVDAETGEVSVVNPKKTKAKAKK